MSMLNSFGTYDAVKAAAPTLMRQLVEPHGPGTYRARAHSVRELHATLSKLGFTLIQNDIYGPPGGRQLFYRNRLVVVRVKTRGDEKGFRANQPHMSVSLTVGGNRPDGSPQLDWQDDRAKVSGQGRIAAKAFVTPDRFQPIDFQGNPQRFVMIQGDLDTGPGPDAWAQRTHFLFPDGFDIVGAELLPVQSEPT
jgi:hypothetical protein